MAGVGKRLIPLLDRILVERFVPETRTKGGIMIPEKAQAKVQSATVVAVGPGARTDKGDHIPPSVKEGDKVLLPEYGGTKIEIEDKIYQERRKRNLEDSVALNLPFIFIT